MIVEIFLSEPMYKKAPNTVKNLADHQLRKLHRECTSEPIYDHVSDYFMKGYFDV